MPQWLVVWLPVIAVFASAFITAVVTYFIVIPRQYQRARAELAYNEYIKNKNKAYQNIYLTIKEAEMYIQKIMPRMVYDLQYDLHDLSDIEQLMEENNFTNHMISGVKVIWKKEGKQKGIDKFKKLLETNEDVKRRNLINKFHTLTLNNRIYMSKTIFDLLMDLCDKYKKVIHNNEWGDYFTGIADQYEPGEDRLEYVDKATEKYCLKEETFEEAKIIVNGNEKQDSLAELMKKELDVEL